MQIMPRKWSPQSAIIWMGVVACLCFSIGEGLRLTPFPVSAVSETETFSDTSDSLRQYGPLNVPARAQSRNKRQVVDDAYLPPERALQPPRVRVSDQREGLDFPSPPAGSPRTGRAPPLS
jgi:hypothetical protein